MHEEHPDQRDLRILVVDDNHDAAFTLSALLQLKGHQTSTAHDGVDAVRAATRVRYDAVVLDLACPSWMGSRRLLSLANYSLRPY